MSASRWSLPLSRTQRQAGQPRWAQASRSRKYPTNFSLIGAPPSCLPTPAQNKTPLPGDLPVGVISLAPGGAVSGEPQRRSCNRNYALRLRPVKIRAALRDSDPGGSALHPSPQGPEPIELGAHCRRARRLGLPRAFQGTLGRGRQVPEAVANLLLQPAPALDDPILEVVLYSRGVHFEEPLQKGGRIALDRPDPLRAGTEQIEQPAGRGAGRNDQHVGVVEAALRLKGGLDAGARQALDPGD